MEEDPIIKIEEAAKLLGVSRMALVVWTKLGKLRCTKTLGGHRRFRTSDIMRLTQPYEPNCEW